MNPNLQQRLVAYLKEQGASDVGFSMPPDAEAEFPGLPYAVSIVVRLSDFIIDEIDGAPTHTYFNHYRSVNAFLDQLLLKAGLFLQKEGYRYCTVAASQSINQDGWNYRGRYSHKKAATLAGLGSVGKSSLFLHREWGWPCTAGNFIHRLPVSGAGKASSFPLWGLPSVRRRLPCRSHFGKKLEPRTKPGRNVCPGQVQQLYETCLSAYWPWCCMWGVHPGLSTG